ncbi:TetR/AcrR family transcriptional regulator [Amycolatopsis suaedae]|uniref:TetR family transcriptional regulator n=1 Tax=Amycolatopsis suaedae TaxID=2510978 RepID=A0A4Q7J7P7_9PSEU|nr:TetR/AcrR family transcriptional regulator [Amycolatopsis suaedae]RZQ62074.1 TetR family transcriptional regulator [Amycolatopsis suaedae]
MSGKRLSPAERRARILDAAAAVFAESGYDAAGMRAVAARAGITTPVLYDHFRTKADLYAQLLESEVDALIEAWAGRPVPAESRALLTTTADRVLRWAETHECGWRMIFAETPADPVVAEVHAAGRARAMAAARALFAWLPALDTTSDLPRERVDEAFAVAATSTLNALAGWWWANRDVPRDQVVALLTDLLWHGLRQLTEGRRP